MISLQERAIVWRWTNEIDRLAVCQTGNGTAKFSVLIGAKKTDMFVAVVHKEPTVFADWCASCQA